MGKGVQRERLRPAHFRGCVVASRGAGRHNKGEMRGCWAWSVACQLFEAALARGFGAETASSRCDGAVLTTELGAFPEDVRTEQTKQLRKRHLGVAER